MSLSQVQQHKPLPADAHDSLSIQVHICGRSLFGRGLEQILEGTNFVVSDPACFGPFQPSLGSYRNDPIYIIDGEAYSLTDMIEHVVELKALHPEARIVLVSDQLEAGTIRALHESGINGICLTSSSREVLLRSIELVALGEVVVSSDLLMEMISQREDHSNSEPKLDIEQLFQSPPRRLLSNREVEVLHWLKEGAPNKVIARHLNVAEATVKVHVKAILKKIRVSNRAQAAIWAAHHMPSEVLEPRSAA